MTQQIESTCLPSYLSARELFFKFERDNLMVFLMNLVICHWNGGEIQHFLSCDY